jgi:hypothetical protein
MGEDVSPSPAPVQLKRPEKGMVHGIRPDELVRLTPKLKPYLGRPNPTWPDIIDAADWLRHDLGVSKSPGATPALPWAASWPPWPLRSSRARRPSISGPLRAAISTAWSPRPKPASCTSNAQCGPYAEPSHRNSMRAREGGRIAVTVPGAVFFPGTFCGAGGLRASLTALPA